MYADSIRMELGPEKSRVEIKQLNYWLFETESTNRCEILRDVLMDNLNSGNLKVISNEEIRRKISRWSSLMKDLVREENEWAQNYSPTDTPYLNKRIIRDDVDYTHRSDDPRYFESTLSIDPRAILQEVEFSNIMNNHYWRILRIEIRIIELLELTEKVIVIMKEELNYGS